MNYLSVLLKCELMRLDDDEEPDAGTLVAVTSKHADTAHRVSQAVASLLIATINKEKKRLRKNKNWKGWEPATRKEQEQYPIPDWLASALADHHYDEVPAWVLKEFDREVTVKEMLMAARA